MAKIHRKIKRGKSKKNPNLFNSIIEMPESSKTATTVDKGKERFSLDERFVSSKKQKIVHVAVEVNKVETKTHKKKKNESVESDEQEKKVVVKKPMKESSCQKSSDKEPKPSSEKQYAKTPEEPKKPVATETKIFASKKKDDSSGESEFEDSSDEGEDDKNRSVESSDDDSSSSEENDFDEEPKPSSKKQSVVPTAEKPDDEPKKPVEAETKNVITREEYNKPQPQLPPRTSGSKLVCMRNLNPSIKESDVVEFFKDAGKIHWLRFMIAGDRSSDFGHVMFDTSEAAQKALKRNGEDLIGRAVKLSSVKNRSLPDTFTPRSEYYLFSWE